MAILRKVIVAIILNMLVYMVVRFFTWNYAFVTSGLSPSQDGMSQMDFSFLWQAFVWPTFAAIMGVINGNLIRNQKKKILWFFIVFVAGLIFATYLDISVRIMPWPEGLTSWYTGVDGKIKLSLMSVILWPITYFISLGLMCFWPRQSKKISKQIE